VANIFLCAVRGSVARLILCPLTKNNQMTENRRMTGQK